ncbi:hypothetical protein AVEN_25477-1 [Araneus ventricosus]|uniref:PID domain-containing protein n=1 Tax=Araneus ventricosus TaxID=182803 RepID=A0A4Y2CU51_ARAVE|nr:hypothetical protein AVEN_25477-1 [Araneus ventricosus]
MIPSRNFEDYLPDGSCFSRVLKVDPQFELSTESTIKKVEYIGSFPVSGNDQNERTEFVRAQLKEMRDTGPKKSVLLVLSLSGIKVCSLNGKAHKNIFSACKQQRKAKSTNRKVVSETSKDYIHYPPLVENIFKYVGLLKFL